MSCDSMALHGNALAANWSQRVRLCIYVSPPGVASNKCLFMPSFGSLIIGITHMLQTLLTRQAA